MLAIRYAYQQYDRQLKREAAKALRSSLKAKAVDVLEAAKDLIGGKSEVPSSPGSPFISKTGRTKRSLGMKVGKRTAYVGFRAVKARSRKSGKAVMRSHANILEHGARHMAARPVLEPALERARKSPFRGLLSR